MWNTVSSTSAKVFPVQWPTCEKTACQLYQYQVGNLNYLNALSRTSTSFVSSPLGPVAIRPNLSANCLNNFAALLRLKTEQSCRLNSSWISHNCFEIALPLIWLNRQGDQTAKWYWTSVPFLLCNIKYASSYNPNFNHSNIQLQK